MDFENTKQYEARCTCWSPPPSGHPPVLRVDLPEAALCPVTSVGPGVGPEQNSQVLNDVAVPKRVESGRETAKDLHATKNFWMGVNPVTSLWGKNHSCSNKEHGEPITLVHQNHHPRVIPESIFS